MLIPKPAKFLLQHSRDGWRRCLQLSEPLAGAALLSWAELQARASSPPAGAVQAVLADGGKTPGIP